MRDDAMGSGNGSAVDADAIVASINAEVLGGKILKCRNKGIAQFPVKLRMNGKAGNGYSTKSLLPMDFILDNAYKGKSGNVLLCLRPLGSPQEWKHAECKWDQFATHFGDEAFQTLEDLAYAGRPKPPPPVTTAQDLLVAAEMSDAYGSW